MSITVIIPTYNREAFLKKAVMSVVEQTLCCDELIIVDDGSTDKTKMLVERLSQNISFPVYYVLQENSGAAAARNTGIKKASSDHLCFLDSDDRFDPEKLYLQYNAMLESNALISHTREIWYRQGKLLNQKKKHRPREGYIFKNCLRMCVVGMSTVMIKKVLFDRYGLFDENLPCCEDYDFWLRVSTNELFQLVHQPLTIKEGGREDQLSVIYRMGMDKYRIQSIFQLLEQKKLSSEQRDLAISELQRKCRIFGNGCLKHGREEEGRKYLELPSRFL